MAIESNNEAELNAALGTPASLGDLFKLNVRVQNVEVAVAAIERCVSAIESLADEFKRFVPRLREEHDRIEFWESLKDSALRGLVTKGPLVALASIILGIAWVVK